MLVNDASQDLLYGFFCVVLYHKEWILLVQFTLLFFPLFIQTQAVDIVFDSLKTELCALKAILWIS